eukprot:3456755-Pyramimonas_sp.AAC.1
MQFHRRRTSYGVLERVQDCEGATYTLICGGLVPGSVFWYDSGSPRRNSPEHRFLGPMKKVLGGWVDPNF